MSAMRAAIRTRAILALVAIVAIIFGGFGGSGDATQERVDQARERAESQPTSAAASVSETFASF